MAKIEFTIVDDWLAKRLDLAWPEKIIIAHVLRYSRSKYGCFKSNEKIALHLGLHRVTVIRIISRLEDRDWLVKRKYPNRERSLFVNQEKLDDMPLMAGVKGCAKPVSKPVSFGPAGSSAAPLPCSVAPLAGSSAAPLPLNRNRRQSLLRYNEERKEDKEKICQEIIDEREKGRPTAEQFEDRKRILKKQLQGKTQ